MRSLIHWFEIPVRDMVRARRFYSEIFDFPMPEGQMSGLAMGFFPQEEGSHGAGSGALVLSEELTPGEAGVLVYIDAGDDLNAVLGRVEGAGGRTLTAKSLIAPNAGYYAHILDTEGNRIALYSRS